LSENVLSNVNKGDQGNRKGKCVGVFILIWLEIKKYNFLC